MTSMPISVVHPRPNTEPNTIVRRSANYQPPIWDYDYVQSLKSPYKGEVYNGVARELKEGVRIMLDKVEEYPNFSIKLELINTLQRLGLSYLFKDQIKVILNNVYNFIDSWKTQKDFNSIALGFRLLRQHGFHVPADIFNIFKDNNGDFKETLGDDINGMLHLYEASYLLFEDEFVLERSATKHLREYLLKQDGGECSYLTLLVSHALEFPLHWRAIRFEARWFINAYEKKQDMNPLLLTLAKLDFNMTQAIHQEDLQYSSGWWRSTGLDGEKLSFARNRLMEHFLWIIGLESEPQFAHHRRCLLKVGALITTIDDIYDVYGTLNELELFTNVVDRWDINEIEELPDYMKICFFLLFNVVNELAFEVLNKHGVCIVSYLKNSWAYLCKFYMVEAKWYHNKYMPTFKEYTDVAYKSIAMTPIFMHNYFFTHNKITIQDVQYLDGFPNITHWTSVIIRLINDLGTSTEEMKRGDVPKSIQCYMHETGATEEDARAHMKGLIFEAWKKLNAAQYATENTRFSDRFKTSLMNIARVAMMMYTNGDGHSKQNQECIDRVLSVVVHPIPLANEMI